MLSPKRLLAGVLDVEEPVLVEALPVELGHGGGHGDHGASGGEQEEGGGGGEGESVPHDGGEVAHGELLRHQVLHLVNTRQRFLLKYSPIMTKKSSSAAFTFLNRSTITGTFEGNFCFIFSTACTRSLKLFLSLKLLFRKFLDPVEHCSSLEYPSPVSSFEC